MHEHNIVRKPWGYEYIAYQNDLVAMKLLHIDRGERTSLHCHPNKTTGLVVVDGQAIINFIADQSVLTAPSKKMIRRGLFHQTHAVSESGVKMLEIETPVDKDDLVRLRDNYGRENIGYEGTAFELPKDEDCIWFSHPLSGINVYRIGRSTITVESATSLEEFMTKSDQDIIIFLQGGLVKIVDDRSHLVTVPGDVGQANVVKQVAKEMDGFADNTFIMTIK
jgi:mannose-6-phosphate isomerase-like protein (cupin superfamily)